jgi:hypothetical protein
MNRADPSPEHDVDLDDLAPRTIDKSRTVRMAWETVRFSV